MFSFARVKPAIGRAGSEIDTLDSGCHGQYPQAISFAIYIKKLQHEDSGEARASQAGVEEKVKEVHKVATSDSEARTHHRQKRLHECLIHSADEWRYAFPLFTRDVSLARPPCV